MLEQKEAQSNSLASSHENLSTEEFLEEPHPGIFAKATISAAAVSVGFFWFWAAATPVYEVVSGDGTVKPQGFVVELEHLEGGRVAELYVSEGQSVSNGDPIMKLDDVHLQAEIEKNKARAEHLQELLEQYANIMKHDFYGSLDHVSVDAKSSEFSPHIRYQLSQIIHLRATRDVDEAKLDTSLKQMESLQKEREIVARQASRIKHLKSDGRATLKSYEEAQIELLKLEEQIDAISGQISVQKAVIAQSHAKEREIITGFVADADRKFAEAKSELIHTNQIIKQIEKRLLDTTIRATQEGIVNNLGAHHEWEVLAPGATAAEIVPQNTDVFAEIEISAGEIGEVRVGSDAKLKIITHDYTRFGDVEAEVVSISPNSFEHENGSIYFTVNLRFDRDALNINTSAIDAENRRLISPGMTVTADIRTGEKTVLAYLIKPLRAISDRAFTES